MVEPGHESLSLSRQCELIGLPRASFYYQPQPESEENLMLMRLLDEQYTRTPFYGIRRMTAWLQTQGHPVNHKRVARLLRLMGLEAIYQKPRLSQPGVGQQIYPYLLRGLKIERINQVWSTDITYIRLHGGFIYLTAVIDWYSRYVLSWEVSTTLETDFCTSALQQLWNKRRRRFSTRIKAFNTRATLSPAFSKNGRLRSVWMDAVEHWTTSSSRDCGARSNTKKSICMITKAFPKLSQAWASISSSTTTSDFINRSITKLRRRSTTEVFENKRETEFIALGRSNPCS